MSKFNLIAAPSLEPITLDALKKHLRIDYADEDDLITEAGITARERMELETGLQFITAIWELWLPGFPGACAIQDDGAAGLGTWNGWLGASAWIDWTLRTQHRFIDMPFAPLQSVLSIKYIDPSGVQQTWDPSQYQVSKPMAPRAQRGQIRPAYGVSWPVTRDQMDAVIVQFKAGYGDTADTVPKMLIRGIKLLVGDIFEQREDTIVTKSRSTVQPLPYGVPGIVSQFRARPVMRAA
jgi:uncharacterized phiE125 gp8 family phage protein